jgi:Zn-dependent metalloprotease
VLPQVYILLMLVLKVDLWPAKKYYLLNRLSPIYDILYIHDQSNSFINLGGTMRQFLNRWLLTVAATALLALPMFGNKPHKASVPFEIANLKELKTFRTSQAKIDQTSGVSRMYTNINAEARGATAEDIALNFVNDNKASIMGKNANNVEAKVSNVFESPVGHHVLLQQYIQGVPVYMGKMTISIHKFSGKITSVANNFRTGLQVNASKASVSANAALSAAKSHLDVHAEVKYLSIEEQILNSKYNGDRLVQMVSFFTMDPMGDWRVAVDGSTGEVLYVKDMAHYNELKANGSGQAWDPNPLVTAEVVYGGEYVDSDDSDVIVLNNERLPVDLLDITENGGVYTLEGPYAVLADLESPSDNFPELSDPNGFNFTRAEQNFEDVMVYYHIDKSYRWMMELGFNIPGLLEFQVDPHGLSGADNSHYVPSGNYCAWGEGGVDDAEDADVIWHEYGHAIQTNTTGGMTYSGETMSLQEGASDYWAVSYKRSISEYDWYKVFSWDGHNPFWDGRLANLDWVYPDDYVSGHNGGQIWSAALMEIWEQVGREVTDKLFLQAHYIWGSGPGLQDAAEAFIQADRDLYGGTHLGVIVPVFDARGLVNGDDYIPQIVHTPLVDTENVTGPYTVTATISPGTSPLDEGALFVVYGYGSLADTVYMSATGNDNEFSADIPASTPPFTVNYYVAAADSAGSIVYHPATAPTDFHSFYVGPDEDAPVVTHTPLTNKPLIVWPATVRAQVTDNLGVSSVEVNYLIDGGNAGSFALAAVGDDWYEGTFDFDATAISIGSTIEYRVVATDAATVPNITNDPESGFHSFEIIDTKGVVLVVDDDPETKFVSDEKGSYVREFPNGKDAASSMADILTEKGYVVEVVDMATAVSTDFEPYTLIIHSSGGNTTSADNAAYRQKLIDYLLGSVDSKLIIEGGEIGYDYRDDTSGFAEHVLHITGWTGDVSGDMNKVAAFSGHPLLNSPNLLPETIELVDPSFGDQDSSPLTDDAFAVYEPEDPGNAGVSFFDHTPNPASGQVVYFAFNAAVANADKFAMLLENAADYLHAQEAPPTGGIEITVDLTDTEDDSGASVNITGPLTAVELTTDASGMVSLSELYDGTYFVAVSKAGYNPLVINDTLVIVDGSTATGSYSLDANSVDTKIMGTVSLTEGGAADGAAVSILGQSLADTTDDTGAYMIDGITAGDITVRFSLSGYAPVVLDTTIANGETLTLDVSLDPSPGIVLVVDDDPETKFVSDEKGSYVRSFPNNKDASGSITEILSNLGYLVDVVDMATAVTTDFSAYTLVIHSSGGNTTTIDNADYRQKLVDYVSASFDNKLIVEGGEVGFDWDEEDAAFAANVLHAHDWTTDNAGTLNAVADYTSHPVMTTPNVLSGTLELAYNGWGDQDGMVINEDAFVVFDPASKPGEAGINIFDPTPNPTSGQIVYLAFNAAVADAEKFAALLENTAAYLHAFEAPPTGSLEVTVDLLDNNNNSGATVEITGPGFSVTELTDSLGVLSYESLYDGTYSVQVSKAGYNPEMITDEVVIADGAGESRTYELSPNTADVTGIVTSSALGAVENVLVSIAEQGLSTTTDNTGAYALSGVSPGNIVITYEFVDHHTETVEATIANDETLEIDVELHPDLGSSPSISLEEVDGGIMITWAMVTAGAFSDDFESGNFDTNGWDVVIGPGTPGTDGPNPFWHVLNSSSLALEGEYLAFADWGYTINSWIKTPAIGVDENSVLSFNWNSSYYWSVDPNDNQDMFVKVSTDDGSSWETIWTYGDIGVWENFVWYNTEIPLGDYAGQEVMVAFNIVGDDAATNALENVSIYTATEKFNDSRTIAYARPAGVIEENARSYRGTFSLNQQKLDMMHFNIYRGHGSSDDMVHLVEMHEDSTWYMDDTTIDGDTYYYTVEAVYDLGSVMSDTVFVMFVSVGENGNLIPTAYNLKQNYPNPFNPTTTIAYDLPRNSDVTFNIYSVTGQLVRTLNQGSVAAGRHSVVWDGKDFNGNQLASGIYFYQIKAGSFNKTMKMMLVK